jgi:hypothetical protein
VEAVIYKIDSQNGFGAVGGLVAETEVGEAASGEGLFLGRHQDGLGAKASGKQQQSDAAAKTQFR